MEAHTLRPSQAEPPSVHVAPTLWASRAQSELGVGCPEDDCLGAAFPAQVEHAGLTLGSQPQGIQEWPWTGEACPPGAELHTRGWLDGGGLPSPSRHSCEVLVRRPAPAEPPRLGLALGVVFLHQLADDGQCMPWAGEAVSGRYSERWPHKFLRSQVWGCTGEGGAWVLLGEVRSPHSDGEAAEDQRDGCNFHRRTVVMSIFKLLFYLSKDGSCLLRLMKRLSGLPNQLESYRSKK